MNARLRLSARRLTQLPPGPGKPKASDKLKKVLNMRMAALQGFGDAADKLPASGEGAANDVGSIASSQAVGK